LLEPKFTSFLGLSRCDFAGSASRAHQGSRADKGGDRPGTGEVHKKLQEAASASNTFEVIALQWHANKLETWEENTTSLTIPTAMAGKRILPLLSAGMVSESRGKECVMTVCPSCGGDGSEDADLSYEEAAAHRLQTVAMDFMTFIKQIFEYDEHLNKDAAVHLLKNLVEMYQTLSPSLISMGNLGLDEFHEERIKSAIESLNFAAKNIKIPSLFLREIDIARNAIAFVDGHYLGRVEQFIALTEVDLKRKELLILAARKRHENDPKQAEKKFIYECWKAWQVKPEQYKSKAAFARAMLEKCEHLESSKKIEDWARDWERENDSSNLRDRSQGNSDSSRIPLI
jgi:hypothetical protein